MDHKGYTHATAAQREAVLALIETQPCTRVIARTVGLSLDQVRHILHRAGKAWTRVEESACRRQDVAVRQWAAEGMSLSEIARRVGTKNQQVRRYLTEQNIPYTYRHVGPNNPSWKGGRQVDKRGYILLLRPDHPEANRHGYVREHRIVMEQILGRPLRRGEVVHHKDGNPANNDPQNLHLYQSNGEHLRDTITGKPHHMSPEGRERIRQAGR